MVELDKNITHTEFAFGDFDKDKVSNLDDRYPLNPERKKPVSEISLTGELKLIKEYANSYRHAANQINLKIKKNGYKTESRIKKLSSIINKLRKNGMQSIEDFGGIMIKTKTPDEAMKAAQFIENNFSVFRKEDYFKNSSKSGRWYRAYHYTISVLEDEDKFQKYPLKNTVKYIEIQIKTRKELKIHKREHKAYKMGKSYGDYEKTRLEKEISQLKYKD